MVSSGECLASHPGRRRGGIISKLVKGGGWFFCTKGEQIKDAPSHGVQGGLFWAAVIEEDVWWVIARSPNRAYWELGCFKAVEMWAGEGVVSKCLRLLSEQEQALKEAQHQLQQQQGADMHKDAEEAFAQGMESRFRRESCNSLLNLLVMEWPLLSSLERAAEMGKLFPLDWKTGHLFFNQS